jgi:hypothetical protein
VSRSPRTTGRHPKGPPPARAGLSLLESAIALSAAGIVLAGFVPTFVEHVRLSKIAEAAEQLDELHRGAASYYATDHRVEGHLLRSCLPAGAGPYPEQPSVDPIPVDFATDEAGKASWAALGAQPGNLRYRYTVVVGKPGCGPHEPTGGASVILFRAEGDLDGDGVFSTVERGATLSKDRRELVPVPPLRIDKRVE